MNELHLDSFVEFWKSNFSSPIPPLPSKPSDLTITQLEQLRIYDGGKLYQNLFKVTDTKKLPANLARDISKGLIDYQNKDLYRKYGWEFQAQEIEKAEVEYQQQKMNKEIAEMEKRNAEQARINEQRKNMPLMEKLALESQGQSMDSIIRARMKYHGRVD